MLLRALPRRPHLCDVDVGQGRADSLLKLDRRLFGRLDDDLGQILAFGSGFVRRVRLFAVFFQLFGSQFGSRFLCSVTFAASV